MNERSTQNQLSHNREGAEPLYAPFQPPVTTEIINKNIDIENENILSKYTAIIVYVYTICTYCIHFILIQWHRWV